MTRTALKMESLEAREVMSNVTVSVVNGDLMVTGGEGEELIQINQIDHDSYRVTAIHGTALNGTYPSRWSFTDLVEADFHGVTDDIRIDLRGGDDSVEIGSYHNGVLHGTTVDVPDDLVVNLGSGNDDLTVNFTKVGDDAWLNGSGYGDDTFISSYSSTGRRTTHGNLAADEFESVAVSDLDVEQDFTVTNESTSAAQYVSIREVNVGDDLRIRTGGGRDEVRIRHLDVADEVDLFTGNEPWHMFGGDVISIADSDLGRHLEVKTGSGDDSLTLDDVSGGVAFLHGEGGSDDLRFQGRVQFSSIHTGSF